MLLSILMPTCNRTDKMVSNLKHLDNMIISCGYVNEIEVIVSDNATNGIDKEEITSFINGLEMDCKIYFQKENIGYARNLLFSLGKSVGTYCMMNGDDDYIDEGYLRKVMGYIEKESCTVIVGNFYAINEKGERISKLRDKPKEDRIYRKKDFSLLYLSTQMSACVFKSDGVLEYCNMQKELNIYQHLSFIAYNLNRGDSIHITQFPYAMTKAEKYYWELPVDMGISSMMKNTYYLNDLSYLKKNWIQFQLLFAKPHCFSKSMRTIRGYYKSIKSCEEIFILAKFLFIIGIPIFIGGYVLSRFLKICKH